MTAFTKIEALYLAAQRFKVQRAEEPEQVFMLHALYNHYVGRHLDGGKYDFDSATPVTTLREQLAKDAAAWREAGCPI